MKKAMTEEQGWSEVSEVFDCYATSHRSEGVDAAARAVKAGGLVVLPTDTVYGVGCDAFNAVAVRALLAAKSRGPDMPVPVQVASWHSIEELVLSVPAAARELIDAFGPGALSIVFRQHPSLSWYLGDNSGTVMLRVPLHPVAIGLLHEVGPMAVSSANRSGLPPAATMGQARHQLGKSVSVYLDGGRTTSLASTIVDVTGGIPRVLREGAITAMAVGKVLNVDSARLVRAI